MPLPPNLLRNPASNARPRAFTLAELIIVSAVLTAVLAILFAVLSDAHKTTSRGQDAIAMENEARMIAQEVRALLLGAAHPASLDLQSSVTMQFNENECAFITSRNANNSDFYLTTIRTSTRGGSQKKQPPEKSRVEAYRGILDPAKTADSREILRILGSRDEALSTSIQFEYATSAEEALELVPFKTSLSEGAYPRVIRFRIRVESLEKNKHAPIPPHEIISAVRLM